MSSPYLPRTTTSHSDSRFDRRLAEILDHATDVFYEKGYEGASMRDLSRATGMSLAGLYYYFESKEKLLYLVQKNTFETVLRNLHERLEGVRDPEERIRIFIRNHLEYFLGNQKGMKVLTHEAGLLKEPWENEISSIRRQYYRMLREMTDELRKEYSQNGNSSRVPVLSLFGMMNWIHTWHNPKVDSGPDDLARQMADIFLHGVLGAVRKSPEPVPSEAAPVVAKSGLSAGNGNKTAARKRKGASSKG
jgi:AcrR family transcriptional regulator